MQINREKMPLNGNKKKIKLKKYLLPETALKIRLEMVREVNNS